MQDRSGSIAVIGSGAWGTTVAALLAREGRSCILWSRTKDVAEQICTLHENPTYLPGVRLPDNLEVTTELSRAIEGCSVLLLAVPSPFMREVICSVSSSTVEHQVVLSLAKGLEPQSNKRMTEVISEEFKKIPTSRIGVLSGPNLAAEVALGMPAAAVIAIRDEDAARYAQRLLTTKTFRLYTNDDVVGAELGGVVKNVIAIAVGAILGLGLGENTKAWLLTRGVAEMARLGAALGAKPLTFAGLTGMGDLIATCSSPRSRNRQVGERLAKGESIEEIVGSTRMVAEGVKTSKAVYDLALRLGVELPITEQVVEVIYNRKPLPDAVRSLVSRELTTEWWGMTQPS
ncbi:MAG: glycerol-3-phosphate dehydrogenase [Acidimicrobiia bacterium]